MHSQKRAAAFVIAMTFVLGTMPLAAQEAPVQAAPVQAAPSDAPGSPAQPAGVRPTRPMPSATASPTATPTPSDGKPNPDSAKKPGTAEEPPVIARPTEPPHKPNPDEFKVTPDADGLLRFNFAFQPWPEVMEWLAGVSSMSLDWQELPSGFLNLSTQRAYSVHETRDLINRHLLARGYTILQHGEVLSVVNITKLNPGLVPRVAASKLTEMMPHEFAKVSFELDWMLAEGAVEELKPMLSPNGKLTALKATNRLEALDTVANLLEIYHLLEQEQSESGQDNLIREFVLEHARATEVLKSLQELLGVEPKKAAGPMNPQEMQQMQQMQQQMAQEMQRRASSGQPGPPAAKKESEVHLIVNSRKNSIVAHAPPDRMAIIEKAVAALDVATSHRDGLFNKPFQIQAYRLHGLSPEPLVKTLQEVGDLDPNTRLEVDEKSKSIVAYASLVDHAMIRQLIDRLDSTGRQFEVMQLRRLAADYVAGTIEFMMIGQKEEQPQPRYFDFYSSRSGRQNENTGNDDKFRVDADVENNMLLLWANELEIEAVRSLLIKLGELPPEGGRTSKLRVLQVVPGEASEFLEQLRQAWPALAPNELNLPKVAPTVPPAQPETKRPTPVVPQEARHARHPYVWTTLNDEDPPPLANADRGDTTADPPVQEPAEAPLPPTREELRRRLFEGPQPRNETPSPVNVAIDHEGRLVITSQDTAALDLLEELVSQLAPPASEYKIFKLQHVDAYYVKQNLVDFFKQEEEEPKNNRTRYYYYDAPEPKKSESRLRLSQRRKLKFIYDFDSNSILVQGADAAQLRTIEELIAIYDKPEPTDSQSARLSAVFHIKYSTALTVAETIKEVYRDLLSSNDKALQQAGNPEAKNRQPTGTTYIFNEGETSDKPERTHLSFKGKLSIGIDEVSNTLLVSAEGEQLMKSIENMVLTLDQAARPVTSVSVLKLGGNLNAERVREVLEGIVGGQKPGSAGPANQPAQPTNENQPPADNRRNGPASTP